MNRIFLTVPFEQKDQAKCLGARWDNGRRQWYVPEKANPDLFVAWISPATPEGMDQIAVEVLYAVEAFQTCWKCSNTCPVISLASDSHHYFETPNQPFPLLLSCVTQIPDAIAECLRACPFYYVSFSKSQGFAQWRNHCLQCRAPHGDPFLFSEPGAAFYPTTCTEAEQIRLRKLECPPGTVTCLVVVGQSADLIFENAQRAQ